MATSGTATFNLDIVEIIEEAYEQAGLELRSGYDLKTARRSLNLLAIDWANRGFNLWTVEQGVIPLLTGIASYVLPADTIDLVESVIRTTGDTTRDISISRIGLSTYATIPTKDTQGRPVQYWLDRQATPQITVWPVPSDDSYSFVYWRLRRIQDAGSTAENTADIPIRFLPCLIAGLAFKLASKRPEAADRLDRLEAAYEKAWADASYEDREKVPFRIVPSGAYR